MAGYGTNRNQQALTMSLLTLPHWEAQTLGLSEAGILQRRRKRMEADTGSPEGLLLHRQPWGE
jgi:hypothetical protein